MLKVKSARTPKRLVHHRGLLRKILFFAVLMVGILISSCRRKGNNTGGSALSLDSVDNEPRDYIRHALLSQDSSSGDVFPEIVSLFQDGTLENGPMTEDFSASQSEFSSITAMRSSLWNGDGGSSRPVRMETIRVHRSIPKMTFRVAGRTIGFQVSLTSKAMIKIFRQFENVAEEQRTPRLNLADLPLTSDNAEKLRMGDLFVLPLDGQLMTSVDGSFLRQSFSIGRVFDSMLGSSLAGQAQTGLRADLLVNGRFEMHIFKTGSNHIRVRFFQQNERSFSTSAAATATLSASVKLIPFSKIHQISEIKKSISVKLTQGQKLQLPQPLRGLLANNILRGAGRNAQTDAARFNDEVNKRPDQLLEFSAKIERTPEQIQNQTTARLNALLPQFNPQLNAKVRKTADKLTIYSDQELRFDAGVSWTENRSGRQQFYADYVFDLRDDNAREAYLQAVSGGAVVLSARADVAKFIEQSKPLHSLVIAERIANDFTDRSSPPVMRLLSASTKSELSESKFQIKFGRQLAFELSESWSRENYRLSRSDSATEREGTLIRWAFRQSSLFGLVAERRERSSGFMSDIQSQPGAQSFYWYVQEIDSKTPSQSHLEQFLIQSHNILGPVAGSLGIEKLYSGEADGRFRGRIVLGFAPTVLDLLFDPSRVTEERIWRSVGTVAESFDNTFGLPFLVIPAGIPSGVVGTLNERECQKVASHWGSFYCHFVSGEFIPRLKAAQSARTVEAKSTFLEAFFSRGFGANKIGSDLLARVVLQLAIDANGQLSDSDVVVQLEARHFGSAAPEYNPRVTYGNSQLIQLLGDTLPNW